MCIRDRLYTHASGKTPEFSKNRLGKGCRKMRAKAKDPALIKLIGEFLKVYLPSVKNRDQDTIDSYRHSMNVYLQFLQDTQGLTLITARSCDF